MAAETGETMADAVGAALRNMNVEQGAGKGRSKSVNGSIHEHTRPPTPSDLKGSSINSPMAPKPESHSVTVKVESQSSNSDGEEKVIGGGVTVTVENGQAPKLLRKSSQQVMTRPPPLFDHLEDSTDEATSVFQVIKECIYGSKYMGYSEHDALDCDCSEAWRDGRNHACGEDSDCINRATKMECVDGDRNCGRGCQNQRFQQKQYADVSVIKTEKKGYGLRVNTDLQPNDFIFEYIGEVINEPTFRRRTIQYDNEGIKHFYFMSLTKSEFVDATKKGNLGRFCNHSCNPNCYVDKWVVGEKLRMGIFAERQLKAGEELVFNYNVDRYGADPQPCYCGEPNCTGFIGGKTQTERATKLSHATIEALGIEDGDGWDTAVTKKPRKKKTGEDDEEYVNNIQPKGLDEEGVRKVMATLMQCKEKWIAVKLLSRIQRCDDDKVRNRVVQMHGYQILRTTLTTWKEDNNVILQILDILYKFPRLTRNKISDSKIEATIQTLVDSEHEDVASESKRLIEAWSKLEVAYRIPRKKFDPNAQTIYERREPEKVDEATKSTTPAIVAPTGPRSSISQRATNFIPSRGSMRRSLPQGWFTAQDENENTYYYSKTGQTTWKRPFLPPIEAPSAPRGPTKSVQTAKALQDIIDSITKADPSTLTPSQGIKSTVATPKDKKKSVEKWRSYTQEKQMKLYENTLFPHIKYVMQKFARKLPKEDLKKFAKEVGKILVASDFKNERVEDPTKISERQEKKVKKYVREFFEKAVAKKKVIDARRKEKAKREGRRESDGNGSQERKPEDTTKAIEMGPDTPLKTDAHATTFVSPSSTKLTPEDNSLGISISDLEEEYEEMEVQPSPSPLATPSSTSLPHPLPKRKLEEYADGDAALHTDEGNKKRIKGESESASPPPPPPPPPDDAMVEEQGENIEMLSGNGITLDRLLQMEDIADVDLSDLKTEKEEERELRKQEEDLMRENEEAARWEEMGVGVPNAVGLGISSDHTKLPLDAFENSLSDAMVRPLGYREREGGLVH